MGFPISSNATAPATGIRAVTPNDSTDIAATRALLATVAGNLKITDADGNVVTSFPVAAGQLMPISVTRVWSTGTTATGIFALY